MATNQINIKNRRASFDYEIIETFNAGIVLTGTEIKSIRQGKAGLTDTYCVMENGELWVKNMYIAEYSQGSYNNHVTHRDRKLLLNKKEIQKIEFLKEQGFRITKLSVDKNGHISLEELRDAVGEDTILVSIMMVNNEIGAVEPVAEAAKIIKEKNPNTIFHVDAIQAYGKVMIRPKQQGIDLLSVSSHKFHGPKGAGFLYCSSKVNLHPIIFGGGQQSGMRSGTENVPGAAGMGLAAQLAYQKFEQKKAHLNELRRYFLEGVHKLEDVSINGWDETADGEECIERRAPHIVSVSFTGVRSEVLLNALSDRGIYVSSGSACSSNHPALSSTLQAIGLDKKLIEGTLRFSFCENTTKEELDQALKALQELLPMLRRYTRR